MKSLNNLFPTFCSFQNLLNAWHKTRRGSARNAESAAFFLNLEEVFVLQDLLHSGDWSPAPYHFFEIRDPKQRTIAVSAFRDRVVHHALVNVLEPVFEKYSSSIRLLPEKAKVYTQPCTGRNIS